MNKFEKVKNWFEIKLNTIFDKLYKKEKKKESQSGINNETGDLIPKNSEKTEPDSKDLDKQCSINNSKKNTQDNITNTNNDSTQVKDNINVSDSNKEQNKIIIMETEKSEDTIDLYSFYSELSKIQTNNKVQLKNFKNHCTELEKKYESLNGIYKNLDDKYNSIKENLEKINSKELKKAIKEFGLSLIFVLDKLEIIKQIAMTIEPESKFKKIFFKSKNFNSLLESIIMIENKILDMLKDKNITPIESFNKPFNPEEMKAISVISDSAVTNNIVVEEIIKGFKHEDFIIRHSEVKVNKLKL